MAFPRARVKLTRELSERTPTINDLPRNKAKGLGRGLSALLPDSEPEPAALDGLVTLAVADVQPNRYQPRQRFDEAELNDLAASIADKGVIQPIVVRRLDVGYELIAGERRLRACKKIGVETLPARVLEIEDETEMLELSLIENLQRHDLNPLELALGYQLLRDKWSLTQDQIGERVGKNRATIANALRLLELPDPVQRSLRNDEITAGHAKAILSVAGAARQSALWKRVVTEGLSVRQAEKLAQAVNAGETTASVRPRSEESPVVIDYIDRLRQALGTKVKIRKRGRKGAISIEFYSDEELARIVDAIARELR